MKDLHEPHYFLGIEVIRTPVGILISQRHYVLNLLYKFGLTECKPVSTPLDRNLKIDADSGTAVCEPTKYHQLIGSLIYLTITRPDLSYSVGLLSQFIQNPRNLHVGLRHRVQVSYDHSTRRIHRRGLGQATKWTDDPHPDSSSP